MLGISYEVLDCQASKDSLGTTGNRFSAVPRSGDHVNLSPDIQGQSISQNALSLVSMLVSVWSWNLQDAITLLGRHAMHVNSRGMV